MTRLYPSMDLIDRIDHWSVPEPNTGCWLFLGRITPRGYGQLTYKCHKWVAHRAAYTAYYGSIPDAMVVCHKCDVRSCVNPAHLFIGTQLDNMRDMVAKGRQAVGLANGAYTHPERRPHGATHGLVLHPERAARGNKNSARLYPETRQGERNGRSALNEAQVREIYRMAQQGLNQWGIANRFSVSQATVSSIATRRTWKHLVYASQ